MTLHPRRGALTVLVAAALVVLTPVVLRAQDAPMFRGNLAHTGDFATTGPRRLDVKWKFSTGAYVISSPVVVGQTVFVGSTNGQLYALDRATGVKRWAFQAHARIASTPAVSNGVVYVLSYDDTLYAIDAATGQAKWRFGTAGEHRYTATFLHGTLPKHEAMPDPYDTYLSSPAVWNGVVYFGSGDSHVYALDAQSGALRWKHATGNVVHSSPAIVDRTVYIGGWDTFFYALDATTGNERWRFKTGNDTVEHNQIGIPSSPAVVAGVVYFGCRDSHVYAVDAKSGKEHWRRHNGGSWVISSPAVANGKVYYTTADGLSFVELNATTGDSLWAVRGGSYYFSSPAIAGSMAYVGNWDGRLYAFDMTTHAQTALFETDSSRVNRGKYLGPKGNMNFGAALPQHEYFYDQHVVAIRNEWSMGSFLSSPVVADHVVFIGSMDGNVYALGESAPSGSGAEPAAHRQ